MKTINLSSAAQHNEGHWRVPLHKMENSTVRHIGLFNQCFWLLVIARLFAHKWSGLIMKRWWANSIEACSPRSRSLWWNAVSGWYLVHFWLDTTLSREEELLCFSIPWTLSPFSLLLECLYYRGILLLNFNTPPLWFKSEGQMVVAYFSLSQLHSQVKIFSCVQITLRLIMWSSFLCNCSLRWWPRSCYS